MMENSVVKSNVLPKIQPSCVPSGDFSASFAKTQMALQVTVFGVIEMHVHSYLPEFSFESILTLKKKSQHMVIKMIKYSSTLKYIF